jgi:hypothetical protein
LETTLPDLRYIGVNALYAANRFAWFEADRRPTLIILATGGYWLDHAELPKSLSQLEGDFFEKVPNDPYSGQPFVYFPKGIAVPQQEMHNYTLAMDSFTNDANDWWSIEFRSPAVEPVCPA